MSGVELIGLASSILQIADLGWKLSYKLYAFSKKIHEAGKTIELISQDISATGAILKQLGDEVDKDEKAKPNSRLCSQRLIDAASQLVDECKELFRELDASIGGKDGHKVILGFKQKLKWSYLEPRVELLRTNLERLKSSLAIMLNVLIYAEQLRSREDKTILAEQQTLVASFATQKAETEDKIEQLSKSIEYGLSLNGESKPGGQDIFDVFATATDNDENNLPPLIAKNSHNRNDVSSAPRPSTVETATRQPLPGLNGNYNITADVVAMFHLPLSGSAAEPTSSTTSATKAAPSLQLPHLEQHLVLIEKLLEEVNSSRYAIDHGVRYIGCMTEYWTFTGKEWAPLRSRHGDDVFRELLAQSPVLARHWHERVVKTKMSISSLQNHVEENTATSTIAGVEPTSSSLSNNSWLKQSTDEIRLDNLDGKSSGASSDAYRSLAPVPIVYKSLPDIRRKRASEPIDPQYSTEARTASSMYSHSSLSWGDAKFGKPQRRYAPACFTCRKRKVRCDPSKDGATCSQCRVSGMTCLSVASTTQDFSPPSEAPAALPVKRESARESHSLLTIDRSSEVPDRMLTESSMTNMPRYSPSNSPRTLSSFFQQTVYPMGSSPQGSRQYETDQRNERVWADTAVPTTSADAGSNSGKDGIYQPGLGSTEISLGLRVNEKRRREGELNDAKDPATLSKDELRKNSKRQRTADTDLSSRSTTPPSRRTAVHRKRRSVLIPLSSMRRRRERSYSSSVSRSPPRRSSRLESESRSRTRSSTTPTRAAPLRNKLDHEIFSVDNTLDRENREKTTGCYSPTDWQLIQADRKTFESLSSLESGSAAYGLAYHAYLEPAAATEGMHTSLPKPQTGSASHPSFDDKWRVRGSDDHAGKPGTFSNSNENMAIRTFNAAYVAPQFVAPPVWDYPGEPDIDKRHAVLDLGERISSHHHGLSSSQPESFSSYDRSPLRLVPDLGRSPGEQTVSNEEGHPNEALFMGSHEPRNNSEFENTASKSTWTQQTFYVDSLPSQARYAEDDHAAYNPKDLQYSRAKDTDEEQPSIAEQRRPSPHYVIEEVDGYEDMSLGYDETSLNTREGPPESLSSAAQPEIFSHVIMPQNQLSRSDESIYSDEAEFQEQAIAANIANFLLAQWTTVSPPQ